MPKVILCDDGKFKEVALLAKENGYGIEVQAFHKPDNLPPNAFEDHQKAIEDIELRSLHGPFGDLNPGSHDDIIRAVTRERFEQGYSAAVKLGISQMVLHDGYVPGTRKPANWIPESVAFWKDFIKDKPRMKFHIENLLEFTPDILAAVVDGIQSPNVDLCLDIGHAHCNSKVEVTDWIRYLRNRIGYVHIHDNHGETDEHLGLGKGNIPLEAVFSDLKKHSPDAIWALEAEGDGLLQSIRWLKDKGMA